MERTIKIGIIAIIGLVALWNVGSLTSDKAFGQEYKFDTESGAIVQVNNDSEMTRLSKLDLVLQTWGYDEIRDLNINGTQVEFRGNIDTEENIAEYKAGELVEKFGFELVEFAPAPSETETEEDSIIIVDMNRTGSSLVL